MLTGLIGDASAIISRGNPSVHIDELVDPGMYSINSNNLNGLGYAEVLRLGLILVLNTSGGAGGNPTVQITFDNASGGILAMKSRLRWGNAWLPWKILQ